MTVEQLFTLSYKHPVLFFDGSCRLCHWSVLWVLRYERTNGIFFSALESAVGIQMLKYLSARAYELPDSIILVENGQVFMEGQAIFGLVPHLVWPWKILTIFSIFPSFIPNTLYRWIARNRYQWFGRYENCPVPGPELEKRMID